MLYVSASSCVLIPVWLLCLLCFANMAHNTKAHGTIKLLWTYLVWLVAKIFPQCVIITNCCVPLWLELANLTVLTWWGPRRHIPNFVIFRCFWQIGWVPDLALLVSLFPQVCLFPRLFWLCVSGLVDKAFVEVTAPELGLYSFGVCVYSAVGLVVRCLKTYNTSFWNTHLQMAHAGICTTVSNSSYWNLGITVLENNLTEPKRWQPLYRCGRWGRYGSDSKESDVCSIVRSWLFTSAWIKSRCRGQLREWKSHSPSASCFWPWQ